MNALVIYESMFGDAERIANAIADGLSSTFDVGVVEVDEAPSAIDSSIELVVVGGPTHQLGLTRPASRLQAAAHATAPLVSQGIGLREWLEKVESPAEHQVSAAAFGTRLRVPRILRSLGASPLKVERRLRKRGFRIVARPESFFVEGEQGPLVNGEEQRARQWGTQLAARLAAPQCVATAVVP